MEYVAGLVQHSADFFNKTLIYGYAIDNIGWIGMIIWFRYFFQRWYEDAVLWGDTILIRNLAQVIAIAHGATMVLTVYSYNSWLLAMLFGSVIFVLLNFVLWLIWKARYRVA